MTLTEQIVTIGMCILGTVLCRFLPFLLFSGKRKTPQTVEYLGKVLPSAVFGMLFIYCLKNVDFTAGTFGVPEALSILVVVSLHLWKRNTLLSIAGGTVCYMLLVQFVF